MDLEVLAPVGDENGINVAINSGANAVYFGLPRFNARAKASNITLENLKDIVARCHFFGVRVYVTINTIIKSQEVKDFLNMVKCAIDAKVDAFIVQDFGMAYLLKNTFKGIVLHASTQMGIHNLAGAKQIEELGFTRVVLSRETKLNDIIEIKNNTKLEIEYFVQGALCVAFSGNCYLSSINADKSGNRGECMQLCRLKYSAISNNELQNQGYLLSTTDLCLINNLKQLIDAGVSSFKIEGRLRRYGYIAESVKQYSSALKNLDKFNYKNAENALFKVFNRGQYNKGLYLADNCKREIINEKFQNHRGVCVGKVKEVSPFKTLNQITLSSTHKLNEGDGLKFIKNGEEISIGVGNVIELKNGLYKIFSNKTPEVNSDVYLTVDSLHESDLVKESKKLNIDVYVELQVNAVPYVRARYKDVEFEMYGETVLEPAKNAPISIQNIIECFNKVDNFDFIPKVTCATTGVFMPKSVLNELRRNVYESFYNKIVAEYEKKNIKKVVESSFELLNLVDDNNYSVIVVDKYVKDVENYDMVIFAPNDYSLSTINQFYKEYGKKFYLNLPVICNYLDRQVIEKVLSEFDNSKIGLVANNLWALHYAKMGYSVIGGYMLNIANEYTVAYLNSLGINTFIKSIEPILNIEFGYGLTYNGKVSLMTLCHCPYKTTYDYKDCNNCKNNNNLQYVDDIGHEYMVNRYMVAGCYFELKETKNVKVVNKKGVVTDIR